MFELCLIVCLIYFDVMSLDVIGLLQVFVLVNVECQCQGLLFFYWIQVFGECSEVVFSFVGICICVDFVWCDCLLESLDILLVFGGFGVEVQFCNVDLFVWLKVVELCIWWFGLVCLGVLILVVVGVFDGCLVIIYWVDVVMLCQGFFGVYV